MAKLVLEVKDANTHQQGDLIVWNELEKTWEVESKASYLAKEKLDVINRCEVLQKQIDTLRDNSKKMATIIKEKLIK